MSARRHRRRMGRYRHRRRGLGRAAERGNDAFFGGMERHRIAAQYARGGVHRERWKRRLGGFLSPDGETRRERQRPRGERIRLNFGDARQRPIVRATRTPTFVRSDRLSFAKPSHFRPYEKHRQDRIPTLCARWGIGRRENDLQQREVRHAENRRKPRHLARLRHGLLRCHRLPVALGELRGEQFPS